MAVAPGSSRAAENTTVLAAGRSHTTVTLVNAMLPVFRTVPLYVNVPPGATAVVGQAAVTAIAGAVRIGQVVVAECDTATPHTLCAVAVAVLVLEQLVGAT